MEDALADGTALRILTVMDEFTREGLAIDVALTTSADRVIGVLTGLIAQHGELFVTMAALVTAAYDFFACYNRTPDRVLSMIGARPT